MGPEIVGNFIASVGNGLSAVQLNMLSSLPQFLAFTIGIALYGIVIYNFYRLASKRDIFHLEFIERHRTKKAARVHSKAFNFSLSMLKYGIIFPLVAFLWFAGFSVMLFFLAKSISIEMILLVSMVIVSAIRITSYYSEDLSRDLAKTLPFTILAIAVMDPNFFSMNLVSARIATVGVFVPKMIAYVLFTVSIEWLLRSAIYMKAKTFGLLRQADMGSIARGAKIPGVGPQQAAQATGPRRLKSS
jgi:hypothetical protein